MAKRTRPIIGIQRRYSWRLYPTRDQEKLLRRHGRMCAELWNALLEMWETAREVRVWFMHDEGIVLFDLAGNHHLLSLHDVLLRRSMLGQRKAHFGGDVLRPRRPAMRQRHPRKVASLISVRIPKYRKDGAPTPYAELRTRAPSEFDMGYWITSLLAESPEWRALSTWTPRRIATSMRAAIPRPAGAKAGRAAEIPACGTIQAQRA